MLVEVVEVPPKIPVGKDHEYELALEEPVIVTEDVKVLDAQNSAVAIVPPDGNGR